MARRANEYTVKVTHRYVHNPEAVERGLLLWATYLAQNMARKLADEVRQQRSRTGTA